MTLSLDESESRALWRERREERRARQREQNVHRAATMHAARLAQRREHAAPVATPRGRFFVGCSGWYYWHWRNCFYPPGSPSSDWFKYYTTQFRTVELNAPFYSWPTTKTVQTWNRQTAGTRFIYSIKANELITHTRRFVGTKTLVRDFYFIAQILKSRLGCFLFQLPPSFRYSKPRLKRILSQLDPAYRNVVEFRHKSWWRQDVYDAFKDAGIIFCSCSGPRLPDALITTADDLYLRFHGTKKWYRHDYSTDELSIWTKRIQESGAERIWAYFNNDREGYAITNAREFLRQLKKPPRLEHSPASSRGSSTARSLLPTEPSRG